MMNRSFVFFLLILLSLQAVPYTTVRSQTTTSTGIDLDLSQEERAYIQEHNNLRVHVEEKWPPFNYIEYGEIKGYSNDYMQLIAEKVGMRIEFIQGHTWSEYMSMFRNHEIDIISNITITEERKAFVLFSERGSVVLQNGLLIKSGNIHMASLEKLDNRILAVVRGYYHEELVRRHYPNIRILLTNNTLESVQAVANGQADAAIESAAVMNFYITKYFFSDLVVQPMLSNSVFTNASLHIGIRNDRPVLKRIIDKAVESLDGQEIDQLKNRWFNFAQDKQLAEMTALNLTKREQDYLSSKRQLTYCIDPDWMPFESVRKGRHVGISLDYVHKFEEQLRVPIEFVPTRNWDETLTFAREKKCDFIPLSGKTPERMEYLNFSRSYITSQMVLATKNNQPYIADLSRLGPVKIGVVAGYSFIGKIMREYPNLDITYVQTSESGLARVNSGELDGYIGSLYVIAYAIQNGFPNLKVNTKLEPQIELGVATRIDEPILSQIFEKAIDSLTPDNQREILNRWMSVRIEQGIDYALIWRIVGISALVLFLAFMYVWKIQRQNTQIFNQNRELERTKVALEDSNRFLKTRNEELREALEEIQTLSGLLPICSSCKKIRDDSGYWNTLETYIEKHSDAQFSHGLCEECAEKLYSNTKWYQKRNMK